MLTEDEKARILAEEHFRDEVRLEIARTRGKSRAGNVWQFLNSAFGLWLLSTVLIGLATKAYTDLQTSRAESARASEQQRKVELEVASRVRRFRDRLDEFLSGQEQPMPGLVSATILYLEPSKPSETPTFMFPEYKDRTCQSLLFELEYFAAPADREQLRNARTIISRIEKNLESGPDVPFSEIDHGLSDVHKAAYLGIVQNVVGLLQSNPFLKEWSQD